VWKKIKYYIIVFVVGLFVGSGAIYIVSKGISDKFIDGLSNQIAVGSETNFRLLESNYRQEQRNRESQDAIAGLKR
jgi:uncharacterized membrane protein